jgi:hypothetical protein
MLTTEDLRRIDWESYKRAVFDCVVGTFERYRTPDQNHGPRPPVFQVAIWTDAPARLTGVSIETLTNAQKSKARTIAWDRENGFDEHAEMEELCPFAANPADFQFHSFGSMRHPALVVAGTYDPSSESDKVVLNSAIEIGLRIVVARLDSAGVFRRIPRENQVWVGVSSARDWYDDVRAY